MIFTQPIRELIFAPQVYPPCDTTQFREIPRKADSAMKQFRVVSLGQFRPEKDHPLQIREEEEDRHLPSSTIYFEFLVVVGILVIFPFEFF